jgi:pimeloyl-ACP methyl ester carboxylesterase
MATPKSTQIRTVSVTANADMLREVLDAFKIDKIDLVGNDSGGGIAQIFAASNPDRVRSVTLTNCDAHDNWPPEAFKPLVEMAIAGGLRDTINAMLADKAIYRSPQALGPAYEHPEKRIGPGHRNIFAAPCADRTAYTRSSALRGGFR